ncbi:MAG: UDP-N-acetylmuramoyl-tripeptide--D-alanyl-D-alanine ligase [Candidatus Omnitrophota bacterium]|nr:MAG: UDP-N-acetylmuramoyl-tripeptide--D-alanyl-D-alanine ligase [Candidatus Omnitrophota bacterium]
MFTIKEIIEITSGKLVHGKSEQCVTGICTDTRTLKQGDLFIALKGENFDGHNFVAQALKKQAIGVLVQESWIERNRILEQSEYILISVSEPVLSLCEIAAFYRKKFKISLIAITGSNGKTTTKEMIAAILSGKYNVLKSKQSFNNQIGVALSLLELAPKHQAAVFELGMNHSGEISYLANMVCPDLSVITNVGQAHLGFFENIEQIVSAKCELLRNFAMVPAIVNIDCCKLYSQALKFSKNRLITFGIEKKCDYQAKDIIFLQDGLEFMLNRKYKFRVRVYGEHNVYNALSAIAVGRYFGLDIKLIQERLNIFKPMHLRMQMVNAAGIHILADCYNANPHSTQAAINTFSAMQANRKIFVFGSMLELGKFSSQCHCGIGRLTANSAIDFLITVGELAECAAVEAVKSGMDKHNVFTCAKAVDALAILRNLLKPGDLVLLKGSRKMKLEYILENICNR